MLAIVFTKKKELRFSQLFFFWYIFKKIFRKALAKLKENRYYKYVN